MTVLIGCEARVYYALVCVFLFLSSRQGYGILPENFKAQINDLMDGMHSMAPVENRHFRMAHDMQDFVGANRLLRSGTITCGILGRVPVTKTEP